MTEKKITKKRVTGKVPTVVGNMETETVSPTPEITFNDIQSIEKIINIASTRGAFRANEMTQVGQVYDRLTTFLAWWATKLAEDKKAEETKQENTNVK